MSNSHKASKLALSKQLISVDKDTTFLAHYDITMNDVLQGIEPVSSVATLKPLDGYFGGGVEVAEETNNVWVGNFSIYNNYGVPATLVNTGQTYMGEIIWRLGMMVDDTKSTYLNHFRTTFTSHGFYGGSLSWVQDTSYVSSVYWRPVNKPDVVVGGTASNTGGWSSGGSETLPDGWRRFHRFRTGVGVATKSDVVHHSFICPSLELNEWVYVEFCCPQTEMGKTKPTPYIKGARPKSLLTYPDDIFHVPKGTFSCWAKTHQVALNKYIFFQWDTTGATGSHFGLHMTASGTVVFSYGATTITSSAGYNDGKWHHYAISWQDGTSELHLYVDGKKVASSASAITLANAGGRSDRVLPLGHRGWSYQDQHWNGIIDEVRMDRVAHDEEEIAAWYHSQLPFHPKGIYRLAY